MYYNRPTALVFEWPPGGPTSQGMHMTQKLEALNGFENIMSLKSEQIQGNFEWKKALCFQAQFSSISAYLPPSVTRACHQGQTP